MNEFFTNAVKSFKKNPITTLGIVVIAVVLIFMLHQVYNHIPTDIKEVNQKIDENQKKVNQKIDKLNEKIDKLNEKVDQNQRELIEKINSNQNEIKDLIIKHLIEKK